MRSSLPLHLKYRPKNLSDLIGQDAIVTRVQGMLKRSELPNAFLLVGPSGCGKTTTSRILARVINCEDNSGCGKCKSCVAFDAQKHPDYTELNAASERGIDEMRALVQRAGMMPQLSNMRILALDEVQQLSPQASQLLLKPIEQPPARTLWILSSMEPNRLLPAIVNRCQVLTVKHVESEVLAKHLSKVAKREGEELPDEIIQMIADLSGGTVRAAMQGLEAAIQYVSGLEKKPKDLTAALKDVVLQAGIVEDDDRAALKLLLALAFGNVKSTHLAIHSSKSMVSVANKLLYLATYCLHQVYGLTDSSVAWPTAANREAWSSITQIAEDRSIKPARLPLVEILNTTIEFRNRVVSFSIPENILAVAMFEKLAKDTKAVSHGV